jgi:hypothetical protein
MPAAALVFLLAGCGGTAAPVLPMTTNACLLPGEQPMLVAELFFRSQHQGAWTAHRCGVGRVCRANHHIYRSIATMDASAPLPPLDDQTPTWGAAAALAREWGLNQLAERLAAIDVGRQI